MKNGITYIATGLLSMAVTVLICFAAFGNIGQGAMGIANTAFGLTVIIIVFLAWIIIKKMMFLGAATKNPLTLIVMAIIPLLVFGLFSRCF